MENDEKSSKENLNEVYIPKTKGDKLIEKALDVRPIPDSLKPEQNTSASNTQNNTNTGNDNSSNTATNQNQSSNINNQNTEQNK